MNMKKKTNLTLLSVLFIGALSLSAQAEIFKVDFSGKTTTYPNGAMSINRIDFSISVYSTLKTACEDVSSITITAPDGTLLPLDPLRDWQAYGQNYYAMFKADNFNSRVIPSGTYKITVKDRGGKSITKTLALSVKFLPVVTVVAPTQGATVPYVYRFQWNAVPGAKYYLIKLWDEWWDEPVYWNFEGGRSLRTDKTYYDLCLGDLVPGHAYQLKIEARDNDQYTSNRSRSELIKFNVAP